METNTAETSSESSPVSEGALLTENLKTVCEGDSIHSNYRQRGCIAPSMNPKIACRSPLDCC